jgi:hypothetical protein
VSPSWRNRLLIALAPDGVAVIRVKRGWQPQVAADVVRECATSPEEAGKPAPLWAAALAELDGLLEEMAPPAGMARVVLSNQFVRYGQVPWTENVYAEGDRQALASGCFRAVFGEAADGWRIAVEPTHYGCGSLAAGVDAPLVDGLRVVLGRRRQQLASLQPHLTAAFGHWHKRLESADGGFAVVEPGCVTALFRRAGRWGDVANRRCRSSDPREAAQLIRQCVDADGLQGGGGGVAVLAPGTDLATEVAPGRLLAGGGPWPGDPWRTMAWNAS